MKLDDLKRDLDAANHGVHWHLTKLRRAEQEAAFHRSRLVKAEEAAIAAQRAYEEAAAPVRGNA